jgi:26S proteasome regulatory subunit N3
VIKTGLRKISISYSRIALSDIAAKLHLDGPDQAEFVCAKAIKDGVIEVMDQKTTLPNDPQHTS